MKSLALILTLGLLAGAATAQNLSIAKEQARRVAGTAPSAAPKSGQPAPAPVDPAQAATLKNIGNLRADFAALGAATGDVTDPKTALLNHLAAAAQGPKATVAQIRQLADSLATALTGRKLKPDDNAKLARTVHAFFNSAQVPAAEREKLLADLEKTLTDSGASAADATAVVEALKAVATATARAA